MDRRCGLEFPLPEGGPSQCDPNTENHCCSKWGYCGPDAEHCDCEECVDYKRADVKGAFKICQIYDYLYGVTNNYITIILLYILQSFDIIRWKRSR